MYVNLQAIESGRRLGSMHRSVVSKWRDEVGTLGCTNATLLHIYRGHCRAWAAGDALHRL
jgi:hypothetical protein